MVRRKLWPKKQKKVERTSLKVENADGGTVDHLHSFFILSMLLCNANTGVFIDSFLCSLFF